MFKVCFRRALPDLFRPAHNEGPSPGPTNFDLTLAILLLGFAGSVLKKAFYTPKSNVKISVKGSGPQTRVGVGATCKGPLKGRFKGPFKGRTRPSEGSDGRNAEL